LFDSGIADSTKSYHQSRVGRYGPSSEGGPSFADLPALGVGGGPAADVEYADYGEYGMDNGARNGMDDLGTVGTRAELQELDELAMDEGQDANFFLSVSHVAPACLFLPSDPFRAWLRNPIACNNNS